LGNRFFLRRSRLKRNMPHNTGIVSGNNKWGKKDGRGVDVKKLLAL
jgi:hypothetical protein